MQNTDAIIGLIRKRGREGKPLEQLYRQLYNPDLYLTAYGKIYRNQGAMTKSVTDETADSMSQAKIETIIKALRDGTFRWTPVRRVYIPKSNGKMRPLGMPTWTDKLVQEVIRMLLEAYYEPRFSRHSHGFRPERGCHTALREIHQNWTGRAWFIEGDLSKCFDELDHHILLTILREQIQDERFIALISELLKAGYVEKWQYNETWSGTPQGGIISPILSKIYLDKLDKFVEQELMPEINRGKRRKSNPEYVKLQWKAHDLRKAGRLEEATATKRQLQQMPSVDTSGLNYRRLKYVRYADDFLLGLAGPKREAEAIKRRLEVFLREHLKWELSQEKTLITHVRTEAARLLGYDIQIAQANSMQTKGRRSINARIGLSVPRDVTQEACQDYTQHGKPIHRADLLNENEFSILEKYQQEYRGLVEYYRLAFNLSKALTRVEWIREVSLVKTLAATLQISSAKVYEQFGAECQGGDQTSKGLQIVQPREGKKPLITRWGGRSLAWSPTAQIKDHPKRVPWGHTELVQRLLADEGEWCGATSDTDLIEVHHIRALKDLKKPGRPEQPEWMKLMAARRRKTMVLCRTCHQDITYGRPFRRQPSERGFMHAGKLTQHKANLR